MSWNGDFRDNLGHEALYEIQNLISDAYEKVETMAERVYIETYTVDEHIEYTILDRKRIIGILEEHGIVLSDEIKEMVALEILTPAQDTS